MHRTQTIDGVQVSFRRTIAGWVACFGPDRWVHFRQPVKEGPWIARRPWALDHIATAATLADCVRLVKARYEAEDRELVERIRARIRAIEEGR